LIYHSKFHPVDEKYSLKGAWSASREQFLHGGLRKFRHSKSLKKSMVLPEGELGQILSFY